MLLSGKQKHYLRGLAHNRKPVVTVGAAGVNGAVIGEVDQALDHHELLKIKLPAVDREQRQDLLQRGRTGTIYRPGTTPKIKLP